MPLHAGTVMMQGGTGAFGDYASVKLSDFENSLLGYARNRQLQRLTLPLEHMVGAVTVRRAPHAPCGPAGGLWCRSS
jgi:hypothetical protein